MPLKRPAEREKGEGTVFTKGMPIVFGVSGGGFGGGNGVFARPEAGEGSGVAPAVKKEEVEVKMEKEMKKEKELGKSIWEVPETPRR